MVKSGAAGEGGCNGGIIVVEGIATDRMEDGNMGKVFGRTDTYHTSPGGPLGVSCQYMYSFPHFLRIL